MAFALIKDIATIHTGTGFPTEYQGNQSGKYPFFKVGDISKNVAAGKRTLELCDNYVDDDVIAAIGGKLIPAGTVVFAKIGEAVKLNRRGITPCVSVVDNNVMGIQPNADKVDLLYFYYLLCAIQMQDYAEATTVPSIKKSVVEKIEIPLPDLPTQRRIAATLDKVSEGIDLCRKMLADLDVLVKARFVEMFGTETELDKWPCFTIGDVADVCVGVVIKPTQYYTDKGIPAFRSLNIGEMRVKDSDWVYFSEEGHQKNQKSVVHKNDVLVVRSGAPGTACVATDKYDGYNAVDIIIAHPDNSKVNSTFLAAFTNMPHGMNQIRERTGGAAQQHFNVGGYKAMRLIMPSIELQNQYAAFVAQADKSKLAIQQQLSALETLKKSLMQEYFG